MAKAKAVFNWADPLLLDTQLTDDERAVRDAAHAYCQQKLATRVLEAFRDLVGCYDIAMTAVEVKALIEDRAKVEIEATAVLPE